MVIDMNSSIIENNIGYNLTNLNVPNLIWALILQAKQGKVLLVLG